MRNRFAYSGFLPWLRAGVLLLCIGFGHAVAAEETAKPAALSEAGLTLMNRPIVSFRDTLLGATPQHRADRAVRNLEEILQGGGKLAIRVNPDPMGNVIMLGGRMGFVLTPDDADPLDDETLETLTAKTVANLQKVITESREARDSRALLMGLLISAIVTVVFLLASWAITRLHRWVRARLLIAVEQKADKLQLAGAALIQSDRILAVVRWLSSAVYWLLMILLIYGWLTAVFARFPYTRVWGESLSAYLLNMLMTLGRGALGTIPNLLVAVVMVLLARGVVGILKPLFDRIEAGHATLGWLDADTVRPTRKIASFLIWIFVLVMAYPYLPGAQTEAFKGMSVLIGIMVSLGASSVVGQAAAGMILMYSRTIRRGEYVRVGEHEGTIADVGMFTTRIRTGRGAEITLPNSMIVGSATQNYSRAVNGAGYVLDTTVTIGYDTPWRQVEAMLIEAARRTPGVLQTPTPQVFQTALSDFYPEYCLVCQAVPTAPRPRAEVLSALHASIQDVFNEYGVQIMSPHYLGDPATEKIVPPANWHAAPAQQEKT